jgi:hypothetical protein
MENKTYEEKMEEIMGGYIKTFELQEKSEMSKGQISENTKSIESYKETLSHMSKADEGTPFKISIENKIKELQNKNKVLEEEIKTAQKESEDISKMQKTDDKVIELSELAIEVQAEKSVAEIELRKVELEITKHFNSLSEKNPPSTDIHALYLKQTNLQNKIRLLDGRLKDIETKKAFVRDPKSEEAKKYFKEFTEKRKEENDRKAEEERLQIEKEEKAKKMAEEIRKNLNIKDGKNSDKKENVFKRFGKWVKEKIEEIKKKIIEKQVAKLDDGSSIKQTENAYYNSAKVYTSTEMAKEAREGNDEKGKAFKDSLKVKLSEQNKKFDQEKFDTYVEDIEKRRKLKSKPKKVKEPKKFKAKDKEKVKLEQKLAEIRLKNKVKKVSSVYGPKKYETINKALDSYMKIDKYRRSANKDYSEMEYRKEVRKMFKDKGDYKVFEAKLLEQDKTKQPLKEEEEMSR